jgi:YjbE family integral membrane protein
MSGPLEAEFLLRALSIVAIDLTVSGENAVVIALAVRRLPPRQQWHARIWGTAGAVGLRLVFIFAVTFLLEIPFLQLAGGVLLIWIAVRLARQPLGADTEVRESTTLLGAISTIVVADAVMSLDNVLAVAGAAHGDRLLALFGVALSLPIVVAGSGLVATLMNRFAWVVALAGGVLGYVAGEMIVEDRAVQGWMAGREALELAIPLGLGLGIVGLGLRSLRPRKVYPARG